MSAIGKEVIRERIQSISLWRREREFQDMLGLGPEASMRSRRSADGLMQLAETIGKLSDDDPRIAAIEQLAFSGEMFLPGATLLAELGRFRFHDGEQDLSSFIDRMVEFAERDQQEMGLWGGIQAAGDNPWGANWVVSLDDDEENW